MGDEWQMVAVREHFSVLNSSRNLQKHDIDTKNVRNVVEIVTKVLQEHLRPKTNFRKELVRDISLQIIKQHGGNVKFGFFVIVTDRKENGKLQKIPIFIIQFGNEKVFIDMNCFTYNSWSVFIENANQVVPGCKLSFPIDGCYRDDRRLQVKFASSTIPLYKRVLPFLKWGLAIAGVAATVLFNTVPIPKVFKSLINLAKKFLPHLDYEFPSKIHELLSLIQSVKNGNKTILEIMPAVFIMLRFLHTNYKEEIIGMANDIKATFQQIWMYIRNMFSFKSESVPPTRFLSIASSANNDYLESNSYMSDIFENCKRESVYHYNADKKSDDLPEDLTPVTKSMICLTEKIVYENLNYPSGGKQDISENDCSDVFLSVQSLLNKTFEEKITSYNNCLKAAIECSGGPMANINKTIDIFNRSLGIAGDPKNHFLLESLKIIEQSPMHQYLAYKKSLELKDQEPVLLIPCMEAPDNKNVGLYRCIGRGQGLISDRSFIKALSEMFDIEEKNFVKKEKSNGKSLQITLFYGSYVSCIWQKVNENNDMEGMMITLENPSKGK